MILQHKQGLVARQFADIRQARAMRGPALRSLELASPQKVIGPKIEDSRLSS